MWPLELIGAIVTCRCVNLLSVDPHAVECSTLPAVVTGVKGSEDVLVGKEEEVNKALHLFAATEIRKAYGGGDKDLASLGS